MLTAALLGNPNVGKTSLFNLLTGSNQYVGNWAGVTVEKKEGFLNKDFKIVDLPGIYAMDTYSNEEKVSKHFLENEKPDVIINIVDASNLRRNLYLTTQLKEFNIPIILVLNMMDIVESKGLSIDLENLSKSLNVKVIPISASKEKGIKELKKFLLNEDYLSFKDVNSYNFSSEEETYNYIDDIIKDCVKEPTLKKVTIAEQLDKFILNKYLAYPIFLLILLFIFKFTFDWVGTPLSDWLGALVEERLIPFIHQSLGNSSEWFKSLIANGIVGGVGSVITFFPVMVCLYFGISFLEDSGYMARAAFIMDKIMRKLGLSGKAFIPLVIGFGCSVPAITASRTLESEKDRKITALIVPLISCNARLPVYTLFASVFFPNNTMLVVFSLYILGIILALIMGIIFKNTLFKKDEEPFIIELPEYKMPEPKLIVKHTWDKSKGFLKKAGTVIFSLSIIIWFLSNFNFSGFANINDSFLANVGKFISPIFAPLGFGSWESAVALFTGITAKEIVLSTMGIIYGSSLETALPMHFTSISAYAFLVFVLLYTPCAAVIGAMKKEYGRKFATFSVVYQFALAWIVSFLVYNIGSLIF